MHQLITEKVFFMQQINNKNICKKSKKLIILKGDCVCKHSQWIIRKKNSAGKITSQCSICRKKKKKKTLVRRYIVLVDHLKHYKLI